MKTITDKFGVDAGNISVVDLQFIKDNGGDFGECAQKMNKLIKLEPGEYGVHIIIKDSWRGRVEEDSVFKTTGQVVIGDICYLFSSDEPSNRYWDKFLQKTEYLENKNFKEMVVANTGGDGEFRTRIEFKKL